ncbi:response regulator transcription factor [Geovibrio ferrireducens]|uniref:response regulator transcription factor n=1 Tax=Geovibrio ferrireducens TaxID=46201 RepID=UPI0022452EAB|nr:response regulator transcription factor [Geovibrio ferrireducens]
MTEPEKKLKKYTVLYAEDDEGIRKSYEMILKKLCGTLHCASDGNEAFVLYTEKKPDILIADIKMPYTDGLQLIKRIRSSDKKLRILMTTAYTDEQYTLQAIELDISRYLVKPVMLEDLRGALQKCVRELEEKNPELICLENGLTYSFPLKSISSYEGEIPLTNIESRILEILIENRGRIVRYEKFESEIWRNEYMSKETLRSHIKFLRKKIGNEIIKSAKGLGYFINS